MSKTFNANHRPSILVKETVGLYWEQIRHDKLRFSVMVAFIPIASLLLDTVVPYFLSMAVGTFAHSSLEQLTGYLRLAVLFAVLGVACNLTGFQVATRHEAWVRKRLVRDTLHKILHKDQAFFANQKIGALTGKFIDFISAHIGLQDLFVIRTLAFTLNLALGLAIIFTNNQMLAWLVLGLLVALIVQVRITRALRENIRAERKRLTAEVNGAAADAITNNVTVKTFANEDHEVELVDELGEQYLKAHVRDFSWLSFEGSGRIFLMQAVQITAVMIIATMLVNGAIGLSIAIFTIAYLQRLSAQLFTLGELINGYDKLLLQATPITEILLEQPQVVDVKNAKDLRVTKGVINFDNVSFAYEDSKTSDVINDMSLQILAGERVGIVGISGAGKTTITRLLLRFDDVNGGTITVDGQNIAQVTQKSLRQNIAYVAQEPLLFHRSLRDNIAYARPDCSDKLVIEAATKAHAMEFINKLPAGLDTVVGERGVKLSGGQRQRIAIARAILKDAPILVLDEATSALDSESEKMIQASLADLMRGRTSIVIAHRLSTIAKLDRIVVLDGGQIVEDGTHAELLANQAIYAKLWSHQSGGFIKE